MDNIFITKVNINELRHLKNIEITLSETERLPLILTGKNGSGKTSVLDALKHALQHPNNIDNAKNHLDTYKKELAKAKNERLSNPNKDEIKVKIIDIEKIITELREFIIQQGKFTCVINNANFLEKKHRNGDFLLVYFQAKRQTVFNIPTTISKLDFKQNYTIDEQVTPSFLQYIVNLKAERSFANDDIDSETVAKIDAWFLQFENVLREIFDDSSLRLEFERKNFNFNIKTKDHELFDFNTLSEGYAALLNIVMELMLRMDAKNMKAYDAQGIVLIDEIETHLHLDLQKKVLPFLVAVFPKIQFVVTTHSPFVLSSVEKAVIYDLEKKVQVNDLSAYSFEAIVETYFGIDQYSKILTQKISEYETLLQKDSLSDAEADRCDNLRYELRNAPKFLAPELEYKILELENLRRLKLKKV